MLRGGQNYGERLPFWNRQNKGCRQQQQSEHERNANPNIQQQGKYCVSDDGEGTRQASKQRAATKT